MRSRLHAALLVLLAAGIMSGCSRNSAVTTPRSSANASNDVQVISELTAQSGVIEDGITDDQTQMTSGAIGGLSAIRPLTFWRHFTTHERHFEIAYSDTDSTGVPTRAVATITTRLAGTFNILAGAPSSDSSGAGAAILSDSTRHLVTKTLDETRVRKVLLRRSGLPHDVPRDADCDHDSLRVRWRVAGITGAVVSSLEHTTQIQSLRIQCGALDTTITDPLAFVRLRGLLRFEPGAPVTLTVTTSHNDDVVLFHHNERRQRLTSNGDGTYTGVLTSRRFARGLWHFGVDAISHGSLYDDAAAYDSQRWAFPYVFAGNRMDGPAL